MPVKKGPSVPKPIIAGTRTVLQELRTAIKAHKAFGPDFESTGRNLVCTRTL